METKYRQKSKYFLYKQFDKNKKSLSLLDINLIPTNEWFDIISQAKIKNINGRILFKPYQTYWITNKLFFYFYLKLNF